MLKLNAKGFAHWIIPALVIVVIGGVGSYLLTQSHAATAAPYATVINTGDGARAPITVTVKDHSAYASTGTDVNQINIVGGYKGYGWEFCGTANATQHGNTIYKLSSRDIPGTIISESVYYGPSGLSASKTYKLSYAHCSWLGSISNTGTKSVNLCTQYVDVKVNGGYNVPGTSNLSYGVKACTLNNTNLSFS